MPQFAPPTHSAPDSESAGPAAAPQQPPVVVKKYANRRLYNTETSSYITLDNLADMIRAGRDFVVYDAKSGEDITRGVLTQIIVEEESKGTSMLPTAFLRQLIGFYGGSLQSVVPRYLEQSMASFARQQQQLRQVVQQTFSPFMPAGVEEMSRQNVAMIERAMSMFNPFHRGSAPLPPMPEASPANEAPSRHAADPQAIDRLQQEIDSLRSQLAVARAEALTAHANAAPQSAPADADPAAALLPTPRRDRAAKPKDGPV
jgi:polyhydroxyalkanoate synthesis repressor PhaR